MTDADLAELQRRFDRHVSRCPRGEQVRVAGRMAVPSRNLSKWKLNHVNPPIRGGIPIATFDLITKKIRAFLEEVADDWDLADEAEEMDDGSQAGDLDGDHVNPVHLVEEGALAQERVLAP